MLLLSGCYARRAKSSLLNNHPDIVFSISPFRHPTLVDDRPLPPKPHIIPPCPSPALLVAQTNRFDRPHHTILRDDDALRDRWSLRRVGRSRARPGPRELLDLGFLAYFGHGVERLEHGGWVLVVEVGREGHDVNRACVMRASLRRYMLNANQTPTLTEKRVEWIICIALWCFFETALQNHTASQCSSYICSCCGPCCGPLLRTQGHTADKLVPRHTRRSEIQAGSAAFGTTGSNSSARLCVWNMVNRNLSTLLAR
jgi:hypothetical protein